MNRRCRTPAAARGLTLLELVVVLVLLGALALVAIPRIPAGLLDGTPDLVAVEDQLVGDLRQARARVMACGHNKSVSVGIDGDWTVDAAQNCFGAPLMGPRNLAGVTVAGPDLEFRYPWGHLAGEANALLTLSGGAAEPRQVCVFGLTGAIRRGGC
ncbi:MAG: prepilin-type N-terminal cleavage/methylation domain-containing protein [Pseudomonadota bacterium]